MKRAIYIVLAFAAILTSACGSKDPKPDDKPKEDPKFPSLVTKSIKAGESATISFSANLDWEASIPTSVSSFFYINDNGVKEYKVSGKAGSVNITIASNVVEGNYDEQICPLTLKMGGQSQKIAEVKIIPDSQAISVYGAKTDDNGAFISESGQYDYKSTKLSSLDLSWPKGLSSFMLPVRIDANFSWSIKNDYPEWLELSKTSSEGDQTYLILKGNPEKYPLDKGEGTITFLDVQSGATVAKIPVTIPGCKDIVYVDSDTKSIELNILGEYNQNGGWNAEGFSFYLTSTLDADVIAVDVVDGTYSYNKESWTKLSSSFPSGQANANVVQDRIFHVSAERNHGPAREAVLLAVPGYVLKSADLAKDVVSPDKKSISSQFAKYKFATVKQMGADPTEGWSALAPVNSAFYMAVKGAGIHRTAKTEKYYNALANKFSTTEIYTLEYNNWYSCENADLAANVDVESFKFFKVDGTGEDINGNLSIEYPNTSNKSLFNVKIEFFDEGYQEAVALYDKSGKVIAVVICRMSEEYWPDVKFDDIRFTMTDMVGEDGDPDGTILPQNVVLEKVTKGAVYDKYLSYNIPIWRLVYKSTTSEYNAMLYVPPFPIGVNSAIEINPQPAWIKVEGSLSEKNLPYIHVSMSDKNPESGNEGYIVLKGGGKPLFVLICERAFMNN